MKWLWFREDQVSPSFFSEFSGIPEARKTGIGLQNCKLSQKRTLNRPNKENVFILASKQAWLIPSPFFRSTSFGKQTQNQPKHSVITACFGYNKNTELFWRLFWWFISRVLFRLVSVITRCFRRPILTSYFWLLVSAISVQFLFRFVRQTRKLLSFAGD